MVGVGLGGEGGDGACVVYVCVCAWWGAMVMVVKVQTPLVIVNAQTPGMTAWSRQLP